MGHVKVSCQQTGRTLYDSRREELDETAREYVDALTKAVTRPGLEDRAGKVVESAMKREHEERQNNDIERNLRWKK